MKREQYIVQLAGPFDLALHAFMPTTRACVSRCLNTAKRLRTFLFGEWLDTVLKDCLL